MTFMPPPKTVHVITLKLEQVKLDYFCPRVEIRGHQEALPVHSRRRVIRNLPHENRHARKDY